MDHFTLLWTLIKIKVYFNIFSYSFNVFLLSLFVKLDVIHNSIWRNSVIFTRACIVLPLHDLWLNRIWNSPKLLVKLKSIIHWFVCVPIQVLSQKGFPLQYEHLGLTQPKFNVYSVSAQTNDTNSTQRRIPKWGIYYPKLQHKRLLALLIKPIVTCKLKLGLFLCFW